MLFFTKQEEILLPKAEAQSFTEDDKSTPEIGLAVEKLIVIDVKGAVLNPGVYQITDGSRVIDAVQLAGGKSLDADDRKVNLAAFIKDGQVVYIPFLGEEDTWQDQGASNFLGDVQSSSLININTASIEELKKLPGIGDSKANAIITYREEYGAFKAETDLIKVSGIGQKTLEKLLPLITVR